jgi:peptidoglycan hydrolase-like protein with peptidoglycan-binding domain
MESRRSGLPRRIAITLALGAALPLSAPVLAHAQLGDETLQKGDSGADVKQLQRELNAAGYKTDVDGEFGADTVKRVRAFEGNEELKVDGKVTPQDAQKLEDASKRGDDGEEELPTGGAKPDAQQKKQTTPGAKGSVGSDGFAVAPEGAPQEVKDAIAAGNEIAKTPYKYGGGHGKLKDSGYDCSGSVSYALRKAGLMKSAMASGDMMKMGESGPGEWITIYANSGHAYMVIAGLRFDTSARKQDGTRWTEESRSSKGYTARHVEGF